MNPIEIRVHNYLERANNEAVGMSEEIIEEACQDLKKLLNDRFNDSFSDKFRLRMSNIGRPTCQLQMEKARAPREPKSYDFAMKMLIGHLVEIAAVAVLKASGVNVEETNQKTHIEVGERIIKGTTDVEIDGQVYDVKSASSWSFKNKFARGFDAVAEQDSFGYVSQGYGYAEGRGKPFGGWIVVDKSTGEWAVCQTPEYDEVHDKALKDIEETVQTIDSGAPFKRCFDDQPETFRGKPTGNRVLGDTCGFCEFKYTCWPGLQHKPQAASSAKSPPYKFYTHIEENEKSE